MAYQDDEESVHDGAPVELYLFTAPNAVFYTYTSAYKDIVKDSKTYVATPIQRTNIELISHKDEASIDIEIPKSVQLISDFAFGIPVRDLDLTIFRRHGIGGTDITFWQGKISSINIRDQVATVRSPSRLSSALRTPIPNVYYQGQCNHVLYGGMCGINPVSFKTATTVATGGDGSNTLIVASDGGNPDGYFEAGEVIRVTDGERRMIIGHTGNTLTLTHGFRTLLAGDSIELFAGCDHLLPTCKSKFSNVPRFGGHDQIPNSNIFEIGLK